MPTNQEWLNQLATESPEKLKAWFDAEHTDNLAVEKVVSCDAAHSNDANAHLKASEDLSDGFTDSRENLGSEPSTSEVFGGKGSEVDSREKLEADTRKLMRKLYEVGYTDARFNAGLIREPDMRPPSFDFDENRGAKFFALLDRQAEITERQYEERVANIERQIGAIKAANDDYREEVDRLQRRNNELRTSYDKLKRERDNLADDLLACNREREQLRKHLGIALDHAHDICSLVDIDGNVLDVGD